MSKPKFMSRNKVIDNLQAGGCLCRMHDPRDGMCWFCMPAAKGTAGQAGRVKPIDALFIIGLPNVVGSQDSLFPGLSQTYRILNYQAA